jgi:uncharacterized protein YlxP (DUF503 family)
MSLLEKEKS